MINNVLFCVFYPSSIDTRLINPNLSLSLSLSLYIYIYILINHKIKLIEFVCYFWVEDVFLHEEGEFFNIDSNIWIMKACLPNPKVFEVNLLWSC